MTNLQLAQAGNYSVVVSNAAAAVTSSSAALTVTQLEVTGLSAAEGQLELMFVGAPGPAYVIETSTNLTNWETYTTVSNSGIAQVTIPIGTNSSLRFFRVRAPE